MLKLTIVHPDIKDAIIKYIRLEDIKEFLQDKYKEIDSPDDYRTGLSGILRNANSITLPCLDTQNSTLSSLTIRKNFLEDCLITVEIANPRSLT